MYIKKGEGTMNKINWVIVVIIVCMVAAIGAVIIVGVNTGNTELSNTSTNMILTQRILSGH